MKKELEISLKVLIVTVIFAQFVAGQFDDIICPNRRTKCLSNQTCCFLGQERYGCCPYAGATCCSDQLSCCPNGYQCDVTQHTCIRQRPRNNVKNTRRPWATIEPSTPSFANETLNEIDVGSGKTQCPDKIQVCPDSFTCCLQAEGRYGCCPLTGAVCCADKVHCCPMGTQCSTHLGGSCDG